MKMFSWSAGATESSVADGRHTYSDAGSGMCVGDSKIASKLVVQSSVKNSE